MQKYGSTTDNPNSVFHESLAIDIGFLFKNKS